MANVIPAMNEAAILDLLEELAEALSLQITYEAIMVDEELGTRPGGFCLLQGEGRIIIDPHASTRQRIRILSEAVKHFDLDRVYIRPVLRELLEQ